ncbi:uncharacterized protein F4812DRAFT_467163 [Daldinia caldariorum]|uniref:uncharacterized protein n=1 Tax=Daldinia caldariorum TaxID=326644 RepID=UPI00200837D1|nr:uncharacterized protein F4812DRAFT_467163 [Daldinia caldariorum]KAI1464573.1 hypothetical protein F4812DRAFT_467163 [Daldinia caldariorum]
MIFGLYRPHTVIRKTLKMPSPIAIRLLQTETKPMEEFFAQYPEFHHNETKPLWSQFRALCKHYRWERDSSERRQAHDQFRDAMISEFGRIYGNDSTSLSSWQKLCQVLRIKRIPDTVADCLQKVLAVHVNLVDLVDCQRTGRRVKLFSSLEDLRNYTKSTKKFFPLDEAKAQGPLRYLLREIL